MPTPSYAARRDDVEPEVIRELQRLGCSVQPLSGKDIPDLLVGIPLEDGTGVNVLVEVKSGKAKLKPGQEKWHIAWRGNRPRVIRTAPEAALMVHMVRAESEPSPFDTPASGVEGGTP
jgi:hypothetical protein